MSTLLECSHWFGNPAPHPSHSTAGTKAQQVGMTEDYLQYFPPYPHCKRTHIWSYKTEHGNAHQTWTHLCMSALEAEPLHKPPRSCWLEGFNLMQGSTAIPLQPTFTSWSLLFFSPPSLCAFCSVNIVCTAGKHRVPLTLHIPAKQRNWEWWNWPPPQARQTALGFFSCKNYSKCWAISLVH